MPFLEYNVDDLLMFPSKTMPYHNKIDPMTIYQVIKTAAKVHVGYFRIRPVFSFEFKEGGGKLNFPERPSVKEEPIGVIQGKALPFRQHEIEDQERSDLSNDIFIDLLRYQPKKIDLIKLGFKHMEFVDFIKNFAKNSSLPELR